MATGPSNIVLLTENIMGGFSLSHWIFDYVYLMYTYILIKDIRLKKCTPENISVFFAIEKMK